MKWYEELDLCTRTRTVLERSPQTPDTIEEARLFRENDWLRIPSLGRVAQLEIMQALFPDKWRLHQLTTTQAEKRMSAIIIYCEGVMADFPETTTWMKNIIKLAKHFD